MGGTITGALRTAQSGLLTNQAALDAVANNIANVNTEGYSRKEVQIESRVVAGSGVGVQIGEIKRTIDEGLLKNLRAEIGNFEKFAAQTPYYERMQEMFGAPGDNISISHVIAEFTQALETLALSPEKTLDQSEMVRRASDMTQKLQEMSAAIQELRLQADEGISDTAIRITALSSELGDFNDKIIRYGSTGRDVSDLRDLRDASLDELAQLIDISYFYRADGDVVVFTSAGRTLVDNVPATLTHNAASSVTATTTLAEGDLNGLYVGTAIVGNDITNNVTGGTVKGLIDLRDTILPNLQSQLDEMAAEIRDTFNQIHNRGTPFPGSQSMSGSRVFVSPSTQTIELDPTGSADDVNISLFTNSGDQSATTTLNTIMQVNYGGAGTDDDAKVSYAAWTIDEVAAHVQGWLIANGATTATAAVSATTGKLDISLNSTSLNLAFRDQSASADGSSAADAQIAFDANADGVVDETVSGFSNFFGLNDFFVDNLAENVFETDVISASFTASAATLTVRDSSGILGTTVSIAVGDSLSTIATKINTATTGITATIVPDGSGHRLRIAHDSGSSMTVTQAAANTLLTTLGMHNGDVRVASTLSVRSDIASTPAKISTVAVQWDANRGAAGEYLLSIGDDTTASQLASLFKTNNQFDTSGGIAALNTTFEDYAAAIVATNANLADDNKADQNFQESLRDSLQLKSDSFRGVNLDEEMSNLILFEQAYSAAARLITVIQKMFDALDRAIG
ncbi:MAG: flagellar hook-associated protein FlgK [Rhodospirillaceae bacterium]|jgi:flagellar hook-associated protein 1|nr:flagellar hook-associated protein FlgK [Rhodospirillaceae bacterium]MBT5245519.1 flagellar hook-associated protein FlgK [Rhodospirillaceae bacterium]MBT6240637.1 flagellar hook-associated protein FlgK [Rhodospirillaceae bacterium]MBT7137898.1 flagellar hook-associated protein FlgK [Rhodospirillaceae bacterium]